jgi:UPF0271 protein
MPRIDLNADMGEGSEADAALLDVVTSANIACGFHAGDPDSMARTVALAAARNVALGAHPGLPDRANFGRLPMLLAPDAVYHLVAYQVGALAAFARRHGHSVTHVKPHGALYHMAETDPEIAHAIVLAARDWDPKLCVFGLSGGCLVATARKAGLRAAAEVFADRTLQSDGSLTPRTQADALIHDPELVAQRMVRLILTGKAVAQDGTELPLAADTICLHSDAEGASERGRILRVALEKQDIIICRP